LKKNIEECIENGSSGSVTFIDLDNFKIINDTFGHSYGDVVLIRITEKLKQFSSENIRVYRIGGDEFILVKKNCDESSSSTGLAEEILSCFADPVSVDDNSFQITCSIGIAIYPKDGSTVGEILKNADLAMYKGKGSGKNKFVLYEPGIGS
jgi:diguanylate cyclase (GGDEF)-like protein